MTEGTTAKIVVPTDRELVARVCEGDAYAAELLFCCRLGGTITHLGRRFRYDDLLGDLFLHLREGNWRRLREWKGTGSLSGWLRQVCVRLCITRERMNRRLPAVDIAALPHEPVATSSPHDDLVLNGERANLLREIEALAQPRDRLILLKLLFEGREAPELAEEFGVPRSHVYVLKARAIARLKVRIGHDD